jgi:hypothetical protein
MLYIIIYMYIHIYNFIYVFLYTYVCMYLTLYTWGRGHWVHHGVASDNGIPTGLGHPDMDDRWRPALVPPHFIHKRTDEHACARPPQSVTPPPRRSLEELQEGGPPFAGVQEKNKKKGQKEKVECAGVGRCRELPTELALGLAMGTHARLGKDGAGGGGALLAAPADVLRKLVQACRSWPEGASGELEGVVRLMGGGCHALRGA